jgi:acyl-[acyl-carrier-protein] desaturase
MPDTSQGGQALRDRYSCLLPLEHVYRRALDRHLDASGRGTWAYSDFLPDARSRPLPLSEIARTAVEISLFTEVNLPWYTAYISNRLPPNSDSLHRFLRAWTAEEDQHATLLESYLLLTGSGNAAERASLRKATIANGFSPEFSGPFPIAVYTTIQELQTRAFYLRAATAVNGEAPVLAQAFRRLSRDETLHASFYRDIVAAHLEADPNYVLLLATTILQFKMPGYVQPGYERRSALATRHLFDATNFVEDVLEYAWTAWRLDDLEPTAAAAREALARLRRWRGAFVRLAERQRAAHQAAGGKR